MEHSTSKLSIGIILFPKITQLDLTGPYEVFSRLPGATVHLVAQSTEPVRTQFGMSIVPTTTFGDAPHLDVVCVPGGPGVDDMLLDMAFLDFLAERGQAAQWVTSVCTGSLLLGAAGLLRGYRATTHWLSLGFLEAFGAIPVDDRVVIDRNRITGGGVTAGIDFGLTLAAELCGPSKAEEIALFIQYAPDPPFPGSPNTVTPETLSRTIAGAAEQRERRAAIVQQSALLRALRIYE